MDSLHELFGNSGIGARMANAALPLSCETVAAGGSSQTGSNCKGHSYQDMQVIADSMDIGYWTAVEDSVRAGSADGKYMRDIEELLNPAALAAATREVLISYGCDKSEARSNANEALLVHPNCPEACALLGLYSDSLEVRVVCEVHVARGEQWAAIMTRIGFR